MTAAEQVREFHKKFGLPTANTPGRVGNQLAWQRHRMLTSEVFELQDAVAEGELPAIAQEIADVVYVAYGTALTYGIDLDAVIDAVHASNMTKLGPDGKPIMKDGKVQKGPDYVKPDVAKVLAGQRLNADPAHGFGPEHRLTVTASALAEMGGPERIYQLWHPVECDRLPYGQRCALDQGDRRGWPDQPGEYLIEAHWSKTWTDMGWDYDAGVDWAPAETEETAR
jgi:predicted HAD superfamily Cof-like phosphohydrolase